jgi:uncharacterized protein
MNKYVLDSYAVLSFINKETGAEKVKELFDQAKSSKTQLYISVINLIEVKYQIKRRFLNNQEQILSAIDAMPMHIESADNYINEVINLKAENAISLGDCFAAALALSLDCPVITGDPEFSKIENKIKVVWL